MFTLGKDGFIHYNPQITISESEKEILLTEFKLLERDKYANQNTLRYRRYANAIILPWTQEFFWLPTASNDGVEYSGYDQGGNNPEYSNIRYFNALSNNIKNTDFLKNLITDDFKKTLGFENYYLPIYVGIHFVKICCSNNNHPGISSPDCFHQDGEPFTFAHLVYRNDFAVGAKNYIASTEYRNKKLNEVEKEKIISDFTLTGFMDSFAVCDEKVSHYVDHLQTIENGKIAERAMILIGFSFTKQAI
ncbi:2OG-Fe dioxygenase family protein [Gallibacterium anatis]|uniref:2OG-Fe dioxygenase family protein n=1 Tax=Gallibacterium anatis TaxID=750 RepID=UPI003005FB9D